MGNRINFVDLNDGEIYDIIVFIFLCFLVFLYLKGWEYISGLF